MSFMKKGLIISMLLLPGATIASDAYQSDFSVGYDHDKSENSQSDDYVLNGTYYLSPVKADNYPYALVDMMERVSSVSLNLRDSTTTPSVNLGKLDTRSGVAQVAFARADSPLKLKLWYENSTLEARDDSIHARLNYYGTSLSYFIDDRTQLNVGGSYLYSTSSRWSFPSEKDHSRYWNLGLWHLGMLENERFYTISGDVISPGRENILDSHSLSLSGDYYFSRALSLGGSLGTSRGGNSGIDSHYTSIRSQYFITPRINVSGSFSKTDYESGPFDNESWSLDVAVRY
jgi:hypothetical protein